MKLTPISKVEALRDDAVCSDIPDINAEELKRMRKALGESQKEFGLRYGISASTIASWEARRTMSGPAKVLLRQERRRLDDLIKHQERMSEMR